MVESPIYSADEVGHHHLISKQGYRRLTRLEESAFNWLRTDCPQCEEDKHWINIEPEEIFRIDGKLYIKDGGDILRLVQE